MALHSEQERLNSSRAKVKEGGNLLERPEFKNYAGIHINSIVYFLD